MTHICDVCKQPVIRPDFGVDLAANRLYLGEKVVRLTAREAEFLQILDDAYPNPISLARIKDRIYGHLPWCDHPTDHIVKVYISYLRSRLVLVGWKIENEKRVGYRLVKDAPAQQMPETLRSMPGVRLGLRGL